MLEKAAPARLVLLGASADAQNRAVAVSIDDDTRSLALQMVRPDLLMRPDQGGECWRQTVMPASGPATRQIASSARCGSANRLPVATPNAWFTSLDRERGTAMPTRATPSPLVSFLGGRGPDAAGRFLHDILDWDNAALEATHDYIEWLFPLPTPSADNKRLAFYFSRAQPATDFNRMILDQFEEMLRLSQNQSLVFGISMHTFCTGRPFRLAQVRQALQKLMTHPGFDKVWVTTPGGIAE